MKSLEGLATLSRQHSTMLDICRAMYSEKSRAFGRGFKQDYHIISLLIFMLLQLNEQLAGYFPFCCLLSRQILASERPHSILLANESSLIFMLLQLNDQLGGYFPPVVYFPAKYWPMKGLSVFHWPMKVH